MTLHNEKGILTADSGVQVKIHLHYRLHRFSKKTIDRAPQIAQTRNLGTDGLAVCPYLALRPSRKEL